MHEELVKTWFSDVGFRRERFNVGHFRDGELIGCWSFSTFFGRRRAYRNATLRLNRLRVVYRVEVVEPFLPTSD
jgi:hypothetical protein